MKKIVIVLAMALLMVPALSHAKTAASAAGKSGGSATAASVSTGTIVAASVGVAVVGALALSNGGSGSSTSGGDTVDVSAAIANGLNGLDADGRDAMFTLMQNADNTAVQDALGAVSDAIAAGATEADIADSWNAAVNAYDNRAVIPGLQTAFEALIDNQGGNTAIVQAMATVVAKIDANNKANLGTLMSAIKQNPAAVKTKADASTDADDLLDKTSAEAEVEKVEADDVVIVSDSHVTTPSHHAN